MINRRRFLFGAGGALVLPGIAACSSYSKTPDDSVPQSPFDEDSTADEVTAGLDLKGRLAVVTGCTSGIGYETMRVLAARGAYVVGTSRSLERADKASRLEALKRGEGHPDALTQVPDDGAALFNELAGVDDGNSVSRATEAPGAPLGPLPPPKGPSTA